MDNEFNIFNFESIEDFLSSIYNSKKIKNKSFSIRSWSKQIGLNHHTALHESMKGLRKLPKKDLLLIADSLKLSFEETQFLEALAEMKKLNNDKNKKLQNLKLQELKLKRPVKRKCLDSFSSLENPLSMHLLEMLNLKNFKSDLEWITNKFNNKFSKEEIAIQLENLQSLGLITIDNDGNYQKTHQNIFSKVDYPDKSLREYHKNVMKYSSQAIDEQKLEEREFISMSFAIKKEKVGEAKKLLRKFLDEFSQKIEAKPGEGEQVYQIHMNLVGVSE